MKKWGDGDILGKGDTKCDRDDRKKSGFKVFATRAKKSRAL